MTTSWRNFHFNSFHFFALKIARFRRQPPDSFARENEKGEISLNTSKTFPRW